MIEELLIIQNRIGNNRLGEFECIESTFSFGKLEMFFTHINCPERSFMIKVYKEGNRFKVKNVSGTTVTRVCDLDEVVHSIVNILRFKYREYESKKFREKNIIAIVDKQINKINGKESDIYGDLDLT